MYQNNKDGKTKLNVLIGKIGQQIADIDYGILCDKEKTTSLGKDIQILKEIVAVTESKIKLDMDIKMKLQAYHSELQEIAKQLVIVVE